MRQQLEAACAANLATLLARPAHGLGEVRFGQRERVEGRPAGIGKLEFAIERNGPNLAQSFRRDFNYFFI